jgi:hypothetical protein
MPVTGLDPEPVPSTSCPKLVAYIIYNKTPHLTRSLASYIHFSPENISGNLKYVATITDCLSIPCWDSSTQRHPIKSHPAAQTNCVGCIRFDVTYRAQHQAAYLCWRADRGGGGQARPRRLRTSVATPYEAYLLRYLVEQTWSIFNMSC